MLATLTLPLALAAPLMPSLVTAQSEYPETEGVSYAARNATDGKVGSVWVEGDEGGSGLGQWLEIELDGDHTVTSLKIWNGNWYSWDFWNRHNRIKELEVEFSDGSKETHTLTDEKVAEVITLKKPVSTSSVKLKIKSIYRGTTFNDTVISEVVVFDDAADGAHTVAAWRDSSHLDEDAGGSYTPNNAGDLVADTMWCEGSSGDGSGEWIEVDFGSSQAVDSMSLINGIGSGLAIWMKGNTATGATLTYSDGSSEAVELKPSMMPRTYSIGPKTTSSVKMTFTGVKAGKEYNDLCVSELSFSG